jgi:hypothetical protein
MGSANDGRKFLLSQNCEGAPVSRPELGLSIEMLTISRPPRNLAKANPVERLARSLLSIAAAIALSDCTDTPAQPYNEPLARRCADLLAIFDKYGVQHSQGSGGPDIIYVGAGIDCRNGRYAQGIQAMEDLLQRNKIPYPPA